MIAKYNNGYTRITASEPPGPVWVLFGPHARRVYLSPWEALQAWINATSRGAKADLRVYRLSPLETDGPERSADAWEPFDLVAIVTTKRGRKAFLTWTAAAEAQADAMDEGDYEAEAEEYRLIPCGHSK